MAIAPPPPEWLDGEDHSDIPMTEDHWTTTTMVAEDNSTILTTVDPLPKITTGSIYYKIIITK